MRQPFFIAEVSSNHNRDLDRCFDFIDTSSRIGCDVVKFQLFKIKELFSPEILARSEDHRKRTEWELSESYIPRLANRCKDKGILFSCTPFYLDAVEVLTPHVDFFKIASYELLWDDLLTKVAATGKPVILSTGMANMKEIQHAVNILKASGCIDLTLLHCVSGYPAPKKDCNLSAIVTLRNGFSCKVGWSDHSVEPGVIYRAVHKYSAAAVEFHLDLDGAGEEFKAGHCWLPHQIKDVMDKCRDGFTADGNGIKEPAASESPDRDWRADPNDGLRPLRHLR